MFNVGNAQPVLEMGETQAAARMLGLEVLVAAAGARISLPLSG
jgi:hypothetical protein